MTKTDQIKYQRCGRSGLLLPRISLGLWHNFGDVDRFDVGRSTTLRAFDLGITHFDLANNYGPPPGSAERNFGEIFARDLRPYRAELVLSTKAGYEMWAGPLWGCRPPQVPPGPPRPLQEPVEQRLLRQLLQSPL